MQGLPAHIEVKGLCCQSFWATEAMYDLVIATYNLCVLLQRRLGQSEKVESNTLRCRLFAPAAVWSRARGKPTLKLAVRGEAQRGWREIACLAKTGPNGIAFAGNV